MIARTLRPLVSSARRHAARTTAAARAEASAEVAAYRAVLLATLTPVELDRLAAWEAAGETCHTACACCGYPITACAAKAVA